MARSHQLRIHCDRLIESPCRASARTTSNRHVGIGQFRQPVRNFFHPVYHRLARGKQNGEFPADAVCVGLCAGAGHLHGPDVGKFLPRAEWQ